MAISVDVRAVKASLEELGHKVTELRGLL